MVGQGGVEGQLSELANHVMIVGCAVVTVGSKIQTIPDRYVPVKIAKGCPHVVWSVLSMLFQKLHRRIS